MNVHPHDTTAWIDVGVLAAGLAHELSNPLAAVIANLDVALRDLDSANLAELPETLADAREGAQQLRQIVAEMRMFARGRERGHGPTDVQATVSAALRLVHRGIDLHVRLHRAFEPVAAVAVDQSRLAHTVLNLLATACRAAGSNDTIVVRVGIFAASDEQIGISTELAAVGPVWSEALLRRCRETLGCDAASLTTDHASPDTWRAVLLVPVARESSQPATGRPASAIPARRGRVLVIDDDPSVSTVVRRILRAEHEVTVVHGGDEALRVIGEGARFDVILCDLLMPGMTGVQLHEALERSRPELAELVVFVTGGGYDETTREYLDRVPNQLLEKPFDEQVLRAIVGRSVRAG